MAGKNGTPETIRVLLEEKAFVNETMANGLTALLDATRYGNNGVVKLLLEAKADVNAKTAKGITPLLQAVKYGNGPMVDLLFQHGADVNAGACGVTRIYRYADENQEHGERVRQVLKRWCSLNEHK